MRKKYVGTILIIVSLWIIGFFALSPQVNVNGESSNFQDHSHNPEPVGPTAALVDSLYISSPNNDFTSQLIETLKQAGFTVDVYQGEEVAVDLNMLPEDYDLLLSMYSAVHSETLELYLFTAKPYIQGEHVEGQYFHLVKKAYTFNESDPVFAVNWWFHKKVYDW